MYGISTLTSKGQATIPQDIRFFLGLVPGDNVYFEADQANKTVIIKKTSHQSVVDRTYGSLKTNIPYEDINVVRQKAGEIYGRKFDLHDKS